MRSEAIVGIVICAIIAAILLMTLVIVLGACICEAFKKSAQAVPVVVVVPVPVPPVSNDNNVPLEA